MLVVLFVTLPAGEVAFAFVYKLPFIITLSPILNFCVDGAGAGAGSGAGSGFIAGFGNVLYA